MGVYADHVVPRVLNWAGASRSLAPWRERACEALTGSVVEIGFGSGHNLPRYPAAVTSLSAVEPSTLAWRLAARRVADADFPVTRVGLRGESVPLDDRSCDAALMTFTLCTVADPAAVLGEVARVVRPGGTLHFLEHGLDPEPRVARWQHRLDPLQGRLFDGCHLTRDPLALVVASGFEVLWSEARPAPGPRPWTYLTVGVARTPA
ncbi:MAG: class I SAM-dependent methyltransferase [Acidimicrobiales bacterium]